MQKSIKAAAFLICEPQELCEELTGTAPSVFKTTGIMPQGGGGGVLPSIYKRCVLQRFLNFDPIKGLKIPQYY